MNHRSIFRPAGFTLIELLVVISIIALLIGILLPSLAAARSTARSMKCLSSERQMMTASYAYSIDYKGSLPYGFTVTENANWSLLISSYLNNSKVDFDDTSKANPVFLCPDAALPDAYCHYMVSHALCSSETQPAPYNFPLKIDSQTRPTEVYVIADSVQDPTQGNVVSSTGHRVQGWRASNTDDYRYFVKGVDNITTTPTFAANEDANTSYGDFRFRHASDTVANLAFLDGHAASAKQEELLRANLMPDKP